MDKTNLARVFGPTIVGHGMAEPPPRTILKDTTTQPRVSLLVPGLANGQLQDICWTFTSCTRVCMRVWTSEETMHYSFVMEQIACNDVI